MGSKGSEDSSQDFPVRVIFEVIEHGRNRLIDLLGKLRIFLGVVQRKEVLKNSQQPGLGLRVDTVWRLTKQVRRDADETRRLTRGLDTRCGERQSSDTREQDRL